MTAAERRALKQRIAQHAKIGVLAMIPIARDLGECRITETGPSSFELLVKHPSGGTYGFNVKISEVM